jgi:catechol 2,3-dioxygenase-like lactoylglutathione lyase family enzyme
MPPEIIGLDHLYLAVSSFDESVRFYDAVMQTLGFKKGDRAIGGEQHAHYFNRQLQISIRPARTAAKHDSYAPGLHHVCLRVADAAAVDDAALRLSSVGVSVTAPKLYPEYADDYYALFFEDPDGIRFELVALRAGRREIVEKWDELDEFLNPLQRLKERHKAR